MSPKHVDDLLMEHFMNTRNAGEIPDADGVGDVGNPLCGDIVRLYLKIKDEKIQKATFKTFGCRAAIATSSLLTEIVTQMPLSKAIQLDEKQILSHLGELPPLKRHCGKLAELALRASIGDYRKRTKGDSTLLDEVARRVSDPREWDPSLAEVDAAAAAKPL